MSPRRRAPALAALVLLAGCTTGSQTVQGTPPPDRTELTSYVALGDSFTAAPLVPTTDLARGCLRSDRNYPSLLADRLNIPELTDVSCSGASTDDLRTRQVTAPGARVPPQLRAVDRRTDLVTLGIGGNDFGLLSTLVRTCTRLGRLDPDGAPCTQELRSRGVDLLERARRTGDRVARALRAVQQRAPRARVVLVGYPRLFPDADRCPRRLPFAEGDYAQAVRVSEALNTALRSAARRTSVDFVDMYQASEGHDICAAEPWVNGRGTDRSAALAYHPFAAGMDAVADQLEDTIS